MIVKPCVDAAAWDAFVASMPEACNYHRWAWKAAIEETFGHRPYYLSAMEGDVIRGILPLVEIRSRIFGHSLVSVPFFSYGGVLAATAEAQQALLSSASSLAVEAGASRVELRQGDALDAGWTESAGKVTMTVELPREPGELWTRLGSRLRNKVRHAEKSGFAVRWGGAEEIDAFYPVFAGNMHSLGTPVYPRAWFANLFRHAGGGIRIVTLWRDRKPVAGAFLSEFRNRMEAPWIASLRDGRRDYSSVLLYWEFLKYAIERKSKSIDLGRCTPGGGTYQFKRLWGCEERPLRWYYWLSPGTAVPHLTPSNQRFHLAIEMWKHLPLAVANRLGPRIVRSIP